MDLIQGSFGSGQHEDTFREAVEEIEGGQSIFPVVGDQKSYDIGAGALANSTRQRFVKVPGDAHLLAMAITAVVKQYDGGFAREILSKFIKTARVNEFFEGKMKWEPMKDIFVNLLTSAAGYLILLFEDYKNDGHLERKANGNFENSGEDFLAIMDFDETTDDEFFNVMTALGKESLEVAILMSFVFQDAIVPFGFLVATRAVDFDLRFRLIGLALSLHAGFG